MNDEMDALLRNDTWEIIDLPKDRKAIGSKWIFKIKYKSSGEINRYKARLVAQGFNQKEGIDYEEIFSLVVKMVTVICICLNQRKYVLDLLSKYGMLACNPTKTPLMTKIAISNEASNEDLLLDNITDYQNKKQNTLSKSSTKAEYRALALVTSEKLSIVIPLGYPLKGNGSKPEHLRLGSVDTYINLLLFVTADYQNETEVGEASTEAFKTSLVKRDEVVITIRGGPFTDALRLSPTCADIRGYTWAAQ
ncbi:ribonuclease H-like domain-containing protein, partial [Tanacetum coccineum]